MRRASGDMQSWAWHACFPCTKYWGQCCEDWHPENRWAAWKHYSKLYKVLHSHRRVLDNAKDQSIGQCQGLGLIWSGLRSERHDVLSVALQVVIKDEFPESLMDMNWAAVYNSDSQSMAQMHWNSLLPTSRLFHTVSNCPIPWFSPVDSWEPLSRCTLGSHAKKAAHLIANG